MGSPSLCLSKNPLGSHRKEFDAKVAEVKALDESGSQEAHAVAAQIMLTEAKAHRAAIVEQININALRDGYSVDWVAFANSTKTATLNAEQQNGDDNGQGIVSGESTRALGEVASGENSGAEGVGRAKRGDSTRSGQRAANDSGADGRELQGTRSGGNGAGSLYSADAGTSGSGFGVGRSRRSGSPLSGNDEGTGRSAGRVSSAPNIPAINFRITDDLRLGQGGEVEKFNDNLLAIRTLKNIEGENRRATPAEQSILARYVGWGGLANAFPDPATGEFKDAWKTRGPELADLLTTKEHKLASRSTLDAHYTSKTIVNSMWDVAKRLGFKGGLALESSMGSGNFLGLMPETLTTNTKFIGVEYDSLTARIASLLYPNSTVLNSGFQSVPLTDNSFDLAIGNPPYGSQSLRFQFKPEINGMSIHNQFFLASLDAVKPGGLQIQVVSRYLLDAQDSGTRELLATKAKLLGAIRLPDTAFKENARTEVVTDIIILQRHTEAEQAEMEAAFAASRAKESRSYSDEQARKALARKIPDWVSTAKVMDPLGGDDMVVNRYFATRPQMIIGTLERSGSMAFGKDITVRLDKSESMPDRLAAVIATLPENVMAQEQTAIDASVTRHQAMSDSLNIAINGEENGAITIAAGKLTQVFERETPNGDFELAKRELNAKSPWSAELYQNEKGQWYKTEAINGADGKPMKVMKDGVATKRNVYDRVVFETEDKIPAGMLLGAEKFKRLKALVGIRDLLVNQLTMEAEDALSADIEANRKQLSTAYKKFVELNGYINDPANSSLVSDMPDGALVQALEFSYRPAISPNKATRMGEKARRASAVPAPVLSGRVIVKYVPPTSASSEADALAITMAETGRVDMDRIASLLGLPVEEVRESMFNADKPMVFSDPETGDDVERNAYLSGQVKRKLEAARNAGLSQNIQALEAVQPEPWGAESVTALLGSSWVPTAVYESFVAHISGGTPRVTFAALTNAFTISNAQRITANEEAWGSDGIASAQIINELMNSRAIKVMTKDAAGNVSVDPERTALALLKAKAINNEFGDWIFADSDRRNLLVDTFNEKFNTRVNRQHDGSHLILPGKVPDMIIAMRRHQKNAIWRGISERFMLMDHAVGAGKTFTAIARAMERRRMGLSKKPAIVVPNHMVQQFTSDTYRLYPGAKVLAATKRDFEKKNRRKFFAKIATGDFDIIIIPHSSFFFIGISPETENRYLEQELDAAEAAIIDAQDAADEDGSGGGYRKPFGVKEAERLRDKITARLDKLKGANTQDRLLTFEQMGIDDLTVDEAHEFKNLFYSSRLTGVKGMGNKTGSQKAFDLYNKVRVLRDSPKGAVTFMTGTPISNSAVEMYTMMRFLAAKELKELGLEHFDAWRSQFVSTDAGWEPNETGRLKEVNRLGRTWSNMRSLMDLYYSFTDSVDNDDIKSAYSEDNDGQQFPIPRVKDGDRQSVVVQPTPAQLELLNEIISEFDALPSIQDPRERNIQRLKLMDRARKVSLDVRAADPTSKSDEKGGKLDQMASEVHRIYQKWDSDRGTQLIFLDRSVPKAKGDDKILKEYDALLVEQGKAVAAGDEDALRRVGDKLEPYDSNEMAELRNGQVGGWNAYQQIKDNLVALGVPAAEVRFIQEANNDAQKQAMFDAVNDGVVRVLIGSTPRMGAGTNVQKRLVALHHGDVTWKPSDIEQREGRIIRQGNNLLDKYGIDDFEVEILAYAVERTIDAKMWSLNSSKLKTINGIRKYDGSFTMEFEDEESVSMAELAALASGDPLLLERVKLMSEIDNLSLLKRAHARKEWGIISQIENAEADIAKLPAKIELVAKDLELLKSAHAAVAATVADRRVEVEGKEYATTAEAVTAAQAAQKDQQGDDPKGKFSVNVNGRRKSTANSVLEEINHVFGDHFPFEMVVNDEPYIGRTDGARLLSEKVGEQLKTLEAGEDKTIRLGTYMGFPMDLTVGTSKKFKDNWATVSLDRPDGSTLASGDISFQTGHMSTQLMRTVIRQVDAALDVTDKGESTARMTQKLANSIEQLPALQAKKGSGFPQESALETKNTRLEAVIRMLSDDTVVRTGADAKKPPPGSGGGVDVVYSRAGEPDGRPIFPRVQRASVTKSEVNKVITDVIAGLPAGLAGTKIHVVDGFYDLPAAIVRQAIADDAVDSISGVRANDGIYIVRSKHSTAEQVEKTLLHELAHDGLRKLFGNLINIKLNNLFLAVGGESGVRRIAAKHNISLADDIRGLDGGNYTRDERNQILTEELLARIAEESPTLKSRVLEIIGMVRNWLRSHGFKHLAAGTDADLLYLLKRGREALSGGSANNGTDIVFSRKNPKDGRSADERTTKVEANTDPEAFKRWFGNSKVVDADGKPLVVYHGTNADFSAFDADRLGEQSNAGSAKLGFFFASNPAVASSYADTYNFHTDTKLGKILSKATAGLWEKFDNVTLRLAGGKPTSGANVMPVYLSIKNPKVIDFKGSEYRERTYAAVIAEAKSEGHDGVILRNTYDHGYVPGQGKDVTDVYVTFNPTQIKSATGNNGNYDPADSNINFSRTQVDTDDNLVAIYSGLAQNDDAFRLLDSDAKTLSGVLDDMSPRSVTVEDISESVDIGEYSGDDRWKKVNRVFELKVNNDVATKALVFETTDRKVWLDISAWKTGGSGTDIYQAVAAYAFNTGKKFIGDPLGLSQEASFRRLEQMISSALRHGTTKHLELHERQTKRDDTLKDMIKPVEWRVNDDAHNLRAMLLASQFNVEQAIPGIKDVSYNFATRQFEAAAGSDAARAASIRASDSNVGRVPMGDNASTVAELSIRSESGSGSDRSAAERQILAKADLATSGHAASGAVLFTAEDFDALGAAIDGNYGAKASAAGGMAKNPFGRTTLQRAALTQTISRESRSEVGRAVLDRLADASSKLLSPALTKILYRRDDEASASGDNFKKWFGNSKVVDDDGKPLVVYHGSDSTINEFNPNRSRDGVIYFTDDKDAARAFAKFRGGNAVNPVYLKIENDGKKRFDELERSMSWKGYREAYVQLKEEGFDGVIGDGEIIVFNPTQIKSATANNGDFASDNADIRYRRSSMSESLAGAANSIKDVRLPAGYLVGDFLNSNGKISAWHKTIGTQYNLAKQNPLYANVYDRVQNFIGDISQFAVEAADLAPTILPKLEALNDIWKKQPLTPEDTKAMSTPIFEGTLIWSRDANGKPVKTSVLEEAAANMTIDQKKQVLLQKGVIDDEQVKRWMSNPLDFYDAAITNRFEQSELKPGIVWTASELKSQFNLNDRQIGLYQEFRKATDHSLTTLAISDMVKFGGKDAKPIAQAVMNAGSVEKAGEMLRDHFMKLAAADPVREAVLIDTANTMIDKADRASDLMERGYAPLSRFGQYSVYVADQGEQVYFGMFENKAEAAKMARKMRVAYPTANVSQGTMSQESYKLFSGVSPETIELFGDMLGLDSQGGDASAQAYQTYLKLSKNSRSAMKRLIERKGIAGFSEDAGRVLAGFIYSNARLTSSNLHMGELNESILDIPNSQGQLKDAATQLAEHVKNPPGGNKLGGLMFAQFLGGSVASAIVNLTQPIAMTFPYLSQFGGIKQSASMMTAAARDAGKASTGDAKLDAALKLAAEEGIVSPQEVHFLQAQAAGRGALQSGDGTKFGDASAKANNALAKISLGWGKLFSLAELTNRRITFIAAYRIAVAQGMPDPAKFAKDTIEATQGTYNAGNKPAWGRSTLGGLAMTFKQYSISYVELLGRMAFAGEPGSKERAEGRRAAILMLAMLFLMSGLDGLPFEEDIEDVIDGILQRMGYNFSTTRAKEDFFAEHLTEGGADLLLHGLSGIPGMPIDVAGRFGMGNLIPATGIFKKKDSYSRDIGELAGPAADLVTRGYEAANSLAGGDLLGAMQKMSPVAIRNLAKGADMIENGAYRDTRGYTVNETTAAEAMLKAIGFQPNSTAKVQNAKWQAVDTIAQNRMRSKEIAEHWAQGLFKNDADMVQEAREMRDEWNMKNPDTPIKVNMPAIIKRVKNMRMSAIERTQNTAPKALKQAVHRELSGE